jgi:fatty-acyl-CoA synthase
LRWSYAEFGREVDRLARALMASGVAAGEHVGIWATNWPAWLLTQFAAAKIGAVLVNINPAYRLGELQFVLEHADITTLLLTDTFKHSNYFDIVSQAIPELAGAEPGALQSQVFPNMRCVVSIKDHAGAGMYTWPAFLALAERTSDDALAERVAGMRAADPVNMQFTSGTTGSPKGAMLTHRNLLLNAHYVGARLHLSEQDRMCIPVPLYHCFGCVLGSLCSILHGAAIVIPAESFEPLSVLEAVAGERCTVLYGVPTMFINELGHPRFDEFDLTSLRTGIMAGSPCPIEIMRQVVDRMGAREMTIAYGLTEASPAITQTEVTDTLEKRVATVGTALPGLEVKICDPETGQTLGPNQQGELCVRGHCVMAGYYKNAEATAAAIDADGWLHTGDLAMETDDGFYRITGRSKDVIIRGGENIYPREVEEFLYTHPKIRDAQIVGVPDLTFGEQVSAWIILNDGETMSEEDVRAFCKKELAHYKVPRYVSFVDSYPLTVTGKIQKFALRDLAIERFGLEEAASRETA